MALAPLLGTCWAFTWKLDGVQTLMSYVGLQSDDVLKRPASATNHRRIPAVVMRLPKARVGLGQSQTLPAYTRRDVADVIPSTTSAIQLPSETPTKRRRLRANRKTSERKKITVKSILKQTCTPHGNQNTVLDASPKKDARLIPPKVVYLHLSDTTIVRPGEKVHKETTV